MNAIERLKDSMSRVETLISFYKEHLGITLDMIDSMTAVTIEDLKILLDGLADRDISLKRPEFRTPKEIEGDAKLAKQLVESQEAWLKGYDKRYQAGRDGDTIRKHLGFDG